MTRLGGLGKILGILAAETAAVVLLHQLGTNPRFQVDFANLSAWLSNSELDALLVSSVRLLALAIAYYLLATTLLYVLACAVRFRPGMRLMSYVTVPALRRVVDKALVTGAITATMIGGSATMAHAETSPSTPLFPPGIMVPAPSSTTTTAPKTEDTVKKSAAPTTSTTKPKTTTTTEASGIVVPGLGDSTTSTTTPNNGKNDSTDFPAAAPTQVQGETSYKVVPGDNLWKISKTQLANVRGVEASSLSDHDVAAYWLKVIDANRSSLRSGDPDLIYPGEVITLPDAS